PRRRLAVERLDDETFACGERPIVTIAVTAVKQHNIAGTKRTMFLLPGDDAILLDERTAALGSIVEHIAAVDDARLTSELPGRDLVAKRLAEAASVGQAGIGQRNGVRRKVELRPCVAVDRQDVAVVNVEQARLAVVIDLEQRPVRGRPGAGVL